MTTKTSILPKILRWFFTVCEAFCILGAIAVCVVIAIDPRLPPDTQVGPFVVDIMGQPGSLVVNSANGASDFTLTALHGNLRLGVGQAGGLIEVAKHWGLPVILINMLFFVVLFDLLRRLFRNVGRGDSFTPQTVRLVQTLGVSLLVFSLVSAFAEGWFMREIYGYLAQHAVVSISGTAIRIPPPTGITFGGGQNFPFGTPIFFSGLLVLALAEVFRQGLALKRESELTI